MAGSAVNLTPMLSQIAQSLGQPAQLSPGQEGLFGSLQNSLAPMPQINPEDPMSLRMGAAEAARRGDVQTSRTYAIMAQQVEATQERQRLEQEQMRLRKAGITEMSADSNRMLIDLQAKEKEKGEQAKNVESLITAISPRIGAENAAILKSLPYGDVVSVAKSMLSNKGTNYKLTEQVDEEGNTRNAVIDMNDPTSVQLLGIKTPVKDKGAADDKADTAAAAYDTFKIAIGAVNDALSKTETGPIAGRVNMGFTSEAQTADAAVAAIAPVLKQIFRTAGEGVFTDKDQQLLLDMIPSRVVDEKARDAIMKNIDAIVRSKLGIDDVAGGGGGVTFLGFE